MSRQVFLCFVVFSCIGILFLAQGCKDINVTIHNSFGYADSFGIYIQIINAQTVFPDMSSWYDGRVPDSIIPQPNMGCGWFLLVWHQPLSYCQEYHVGGTFEIDQKVKKGAQIFWGGKVYYGSAASPRVILASTNNLGLYVSNPSTVDTVTVSELQWAISPEMFDLDSLYWGNYSLDTLSWSDVTGTPFQLNPEESFLFDIDENELESGQYALLRCISGNAPHYDFNQDVGQALTDDLLDFCYPTYAHLSFFAARIHNKCVMLEWQTQAEIDNAGFNIYKSRDRSGVLTRINEDLIPASGSILEGGEYSYQDCNVVSGFSYYYWLQSVDIHGNDEMIEPVSIAFSDTGNKKDCPAEIPCRLDQNFPNPFNPYTTIQYELFSDCIVKLDVFNSAGQKVITLVNEYQIAGFKSVKWDGKNKKGHRIPSGIYFYRLLAGNYVEVKKMTLIK